MGHTSISILIFRQLVCFFLYSNQTTKSITSNNCLAKLIYHFYKIKKVRQTDRRTAKDIQTFEKYPSPHSVSFNILPNLVFAFD